MRSIMCVICLILCTTIFAGESRWCPDLSSESHPPINTTFWDVAYIKKAKTYRFLNVKIPHNYANIPLVTCHYDTLQLNHMGPIAPDNRNHAWTLVNIGGISFYQCNLQAGKQGGCLFNTF